MSSSQSSRSGGSGGHGRGSHSGRKERSAQRSVRQLIESIQSHRLNTLTELVRVERIAATCEDENDAIAFQGPMTAAWEYYVVTSRQLLSELRGLTQSYPFSGELLADAQTRVRNDPESNRSWNLAWLCLRKIIDDDLIPVYAAYEAARPEMWGGREPEPEEADQLAQCFEFEWSTAVSTMLRHWSATPTWY